MPRIIHALPSSRRRKTWIIRTDGVVDVTLQGEDQALGYARLVAQRLADRLGKPVILRVWSVFERYKDEVFVPVPDPLQNPLRRKAA
jgi:hypothetical protein